ncbi:amino acid permease [Angomonas deanei]|uniref:Amino acid permease, putative n=1 Tax=Angomonas deanei TaxID=59799 RepID=A0A7G2CCA3_9TRYP|nr:amino acid permease [Angomonas deanei]CAD2216577.1 Amino acid permease, putative [Angomonas deanei]|eukprot:EPY29469.1 amino acid permease [Angomonas deanei]
MREGRPLLNPRDASLTRGRSSSPIVRFRSPRSMNETRPKAVLTTLTLLGVIYTASISGGYGLEDSVSAGGPLLSIIFLCLIPFVWGIPVSMCVAELACSIPSNAGPIMWVNCSFPSWVTFSTVLWTAFLNAVDNSLYPAVLADYCATLFNLGFMEKTIIKICFLSLCATINIVGVMLVGTFSVAIMFITILPFFLMFVLQLPHGLDWERIAYVPEKVNWALFLPVVAWNFSGFDSAGNVIEEVQNPNPTFIRALILMIIAALATYIPPILAGASAPKLKDIPFDHWGDGFWVKVGEAVGGTPMAVTVMIGGAISTLGLMTTLLATTSRSLAGMGTLNAFPTFFSKWLEKYSERYSTPVNAIVVNALVTMVLSVTLTFQTLVQLDQVLYAVRLIMILSAFLKLRLSVPFLERPYLAPGGTIAAWLWAGVPIAFSVFLIVMAMTGGNLIFYSSLGLIFGTLLVSFVVVRFFRPDGFEGELVEEYEDADMQTYGTILEMESSEWRKYHPTKTFIENPPKINHKRFNQTKEFF